MSDEGADLNLLVLPSGSINDNETQSTRQVLVKGDVIDQPRLVTIAANDSQPIRTILVSLGLPSHVIGGTVVPDGQEPHVNRRGALHCVEYTCGGLLGGGHPKASTL